MSKIIKKKCLNLNWAKLKKGFKAKKGKYMSPRPWQRRAFELLSDEARGIVSSPMGAGKSFLIDSLSLYDLLSKPKIKIIIATSQKAIANSFSTKFIELPDGTKVKWSISNATNLMSSEGKISDERKVDTALAFLERDIDPKDLSSRVLLISHQVGFALNKKLEKEKIGRAHV